MYLHFMDKVEWISWEKQDNASNCITVFLLSVYDIWRFSDVLLFSVDLIWWLICIHLFKPL